MAKWGILATGSIAGVFADAILRVDGAELEAVASRSAGKAKAFADKLGIKKAYASYEELVLDDEIDIVYIATPMSCHYENVKLCLNNGKHVLCEKAVTLNTAQLDELIALAKAKELFFMEAMWTKFLPAINKALVWVNEGKIGKIKYIKEDFCCNAGYDPQSRLFARELGGGAMLDLGVYAIAFTCEFLGYEPKNIMSVANIGETGTDFDSTVLLDYGENAASISMGFSTDADNIATVVGESGKIRFDACFMNTRTVCLFDKHGKLVERFEGDYQGLGYEFEIVEAESCLKAGVIQSKRNPLCQTRAVMKIMDECRCSWGVKYPCEE